MNHAPATSTLLVLIDGRLPTGSHVHSGGMEEAVADGRVGGLESLRCYLRGRLATVGLVDAALAAAGAGLDASGDGWAALDAEAAARCPAPALRRAGRSQGRGLLRVARRLWPLAPVIDTAAGLHADGPLWPVAVAAAASASRVGRAGAALVAAQASVTGPAWASVRLLGLDPLAVAAILADLAPAVDEVADRAQACAGGRALPAASGPVCDIAAQVHAAREVRLFAS